MKSILAMILIMTMTAPLALAQQDDSQVSPRSLPVYNEYYTVTEKTQSSSISQFSNFNYDLGTAEFMQLARKVILNLMQWTLHNEVRPVPQEDYMRKLHFGRWINDPTDETCMNTRAKVLVRDSAGDVTFRNNKQCVVESGLWQDNYTGQELTSSRQIQVDHMVPLKNAYISGAFNWDYKTRCLYANYMGYREHLISAEARQNMSKGDRGPEKYLPPELSYRCQYIKNWLMVKLIWRLNMTMDEIQSIHEVATNYNCSPAMFKVTKTEVDEQRRYIVDNIEFCTINKR